MTKPGPTTVPATRLVWIDHLRTLMIVLVVNMHACVTYSHVGDWYVNESPEPDIGTKIGFLYWQAHLQAFFMGLLFFIAGYFAQRSLTRRSAGAFLRERLVRLGLPALFYMLILHPLIVAGLNPFRMSLEQRRSYLIDYYTHGRFIGESGPLWFALALLLFCLGLAAVRQWVVSGAPSATSAPPRMSRIALFAFILVGVTFLIRTVQPIGTNVLNFQLCFFPQYIAAFVVGGFASRHGWLLSLAHSQLSFGLGAAALVLGPLALTGVLAVSPPILPDTTPAFFGGWSVPALAYAAWEQLTGIALAMGLLALFSRKLTADSTWATWLSERSFGVYVLHAPVLVALTLALRPFAVSNPLVMTLVLTALGLLASYAAADLTRRIPGLRSIL